MPLTPLDSEIDYTDEVATFGDRLTAAREAKGLTQKGLSEKLGVKKKVIEAWENDRKEPRGNRIQMLAGLLNVSLIWLINGESEESEAVSHSANTQIAINDTLGEIAVLRESLSAAVDRLDRLENRLLAHKDPSIDQI